MRVTTLIQVNGLGLVWPRMRELLRRFCVDVVAEIYGR